MPFLNKYKMTTDFGTLKNDSNGVSVSVTIPNGSTIAAGTRKVYSNTVSAGTTNAGHRATMESSRHPGKHPGSILFTDVTVSVPGFPAFNLITLYVFIERTNATTIRIYTEIFNPTPATMTVTSNEVVTATISTFLSPFE